MAFADFSETVDSPEWRRSLARRLLTWFRKHARDLPWRHTQDLYAIWISEVMLQQTQVATVIPYWQRFLKQFPDLRTLAAAREQEVLRLWEGLGYYRRARQLHAAAQQMVEQHRSQFPTDFAAVRSLPGIGRYTAGAILSIGRDQPLPILEANTIRVFSRITALPVDPKSTAGQKQLWTIAEKVLPKKNCGAFNQALMELGSEICTPKAPQCEVCPIAELCQARRHNLVAQIPRLAKPTHYTALTEFAVVIRKRGRVLLRQCQSGERWAGLWDFPRFAMPENEDRVALHGQIGQRVRELTGVNIKVGQHLTTLKHGVTRFRITLHCYEASARSNGGKGLNEGSGEAMRWLTVRELDSYPLSVTGRKITQLLRNME